MLVILTGYEITTRAILKNLLPADAAIPKTQGQLGRGSALSLG